MLRFIFGLPGSGKSTTIIDEIMNKNLNAIILCPEQYSFSTERLLLERMGITGLGGVEVLSPRRLASRIIPSTCTVLGNSGKLAIIHYALQQLELTVFKGASDKPGFAAMLMGLIAEFKRYNIPPDSLSQENLSPLLQHKLDDIKAIYEFYNSFIQEKYIDADDIMLKTAQYVPTALKDVHIYIDQYKDFTPSELVFIEQLLIAATQVTVTIPSLPPLLEMTIFKPLSNTVKSLNRLAQRNGVSGLPPIILEGSRKHSQELSFIQQNYHVQSQHCKPTENVAVFCAKNPLTEVQFVANEIKNHVLNGGRYSDITVAHRNGDNWDLIDMIFTECDIPFYISRKLPAANHSVISFILSALETISNNYSHESMQKYLKHLMTETDAAHIDILENYCLEAGIKYSDWTNQARWDRKLGLFNARESNPRLTELINTVRLQCVTPILQLQKELAASQQVSSKCKAVFNFLTNVKLQNTLEKLCQQLHNQGEIGAEQQFKQVYNLFVELLEQVTEALGNEKMGNKRFINLLKTALEAVQIGIIPPTVDQVTVIEIDKLSGNSCKICYITGVNSGVFPATPHKEGIISDSERMHLEKHGVQLAPTALDGTIAEQLLVFTALLTPSEQLTLSYSLSTLDGKVMRVSPIIGELQRLFPKLKIDNDLECDGYIISPTSALLALSCAIGTGRLDAKWAGVKNWFENSQYAHQLENLMNVHNSKNQSVTLPEELAAKLYGDISSVSTLESYSKCPFLHFMSYGLKARPRPSLAVSSMDIGSLLHSTVERFCKMLQQEAIRWTAVDDDFIEEKVPEIVQSSPLINFEYIKTSPRLVQLLTRLQRLVVRALKLIKQHIIRGNFEPLGYELTFDAQGNFKPLTIKLPTGESFKLRGKIDRADTYETPNGTYIRIVDYKSGNKKFDLNDIYSGLNLQLAVYLTAVAEQDTPYIPAGMLYFKLDNPLVAAEYETEQSEIEECLLKQLKMTGMLINDANVIRAMDNNIDKYSQFLPAYVIGDKVYDKFPSATLLQMKGLQRLVKQTATKLFSEIKGGKTTILPYKKGDETPCDWCNYKTVCDFDRDCNGYRTIRKIPAAQCLKQLENEKECQP